MSNVMSVKEWRLHLDSKRPPKEKPALRDLNLYDILIGIDPGTKTGICIVNKRNGNLLIETLKIHEAMHYVRQYCDMYANVLVRFEDARLRTWFGNTGKERMKGAGSVERDCKIWEDFLASLTCHVDKVHPKHVKASTDKDFAARTGYSGRTSIHAREAAWMVI